MTHRPIFWTRCLRAILPMLLLLAFSAETGAQSPPALREDYQALLDIRDDLLRQLERKQDAAVKKGPIRYLDLMLGDGADYSDARLVLRQAGGQWASAFAEVPAWQQGTMQEWRGFHHRNQAGTDWRPNVRYDADTGNLRFDGDHIAGPMKIAYRLDQTVDERMPPGSAPTYWDKFVPVGNSVPRPQAFEIDARTIEGAMRFDLVLEGGIHQKATDKKSKKTTTIRRPILVQFQTPATRFTPVTAQTPTWSGGLHEGDATDLTFKDGRLTGKLIVIIHSDGYVPTRGSDRPMKLTFDIDAKVEHHELTGSYAATGEMGDFAGVIRGRAGQLIKGRFSSTGAFGEQTGPITGMLIDNPAPPTAQLSKASALPNDERQAVNEAAKQVDRLLHDIRALHLAIDQFPLSFDNAQHQTDTAQAAWPDEPEATTVAAYVHRARQLAEAAPAPGKPLPGVIHETTGVSPSTDLAVADHEDGTNMLPAQLDDHWLTLERWSIIGPFEQRVGLEANAGRVAEIVPVPDIRYVQPMDRLGAERDNAAVHQWQSAETHLSRLAPPWDKPTFYNRFRGEQWYARSVVRSPKRQQVWISAEASDFGKLWVNGELVWVDDEKPWANRQRGRTFVPVTLNGGENELLIRGHRDRRPSWSRIAIGGEHPQQPALEEVVDVKPEPRADANRFPVAWDIDEGINIAWRNTDIGNGPRPAVAGDLLLVTDGPERLLAIEAATGKQRWTDALNALALVDRQAYGRWTTQHDPDKRWEIISGVDELGLRARRYSELAMDAPITDGTHVWAHSRTGAVGAWTVAGEQRWQTRTNLGHARMHLYEDLLLIEGEAGHAWPVPDEMRHRGDEKEKRNARHVGILVFDAKSGELKHRFTLPGAFDDDNSRLLTANDSRHKAAALLTSTGHLIDLPQLQLRPPMDVDIPVQGGSNVQAISAVGSYQVCQNDERLYLTLQDQSIAIRTWVAPDGRLAYANDWERNYEHSGFGSITAPATATADYLFQWQPVLERGPHCPDPRLELHALDARTGRSLARLKPALDNAVQHYTAPTVAGGYVYALDSGGGSHGGHPTHGQIAVATADGNLQLLARNRIDIGTRTKPVFVGERMILRSGKGLVCIAVTTPQGRAYQNRVIADTLLESIGNYPITSTPKPISPAKFSKLGRDVPVGKLMDGLATEFWLGAGPLKNADAATDAALDQSGPLSIGQDVTAGNTTVTFRALGRDCAFRDPTQFVAQYYLQGTGENISIFRSRVDPRCVAGPDPGSGLLYTVLNNSRDRVVMPLVPGSDADKPGYSLWLNGEPLALDEPLHLPAGLYPILVRIDPAFFDIGQQKIHQPISVTKAAEADAVDTEIWPSKWQVVGLPPDAPALDVTSINKLPESVTVGERNMPLFTAPAKDGTVNLLPLVDLRPGDKPEFEDAPLTQPIGLPSIGYAFAVIDAPEDGYLYITAGADWFMRWFVDGREVYSTLKGGNGAAPTDVKAHPFTVPISKGKHLIAVEIKPGSKGWSFTSLGAFSTKSPDELADYHTPSKVRREAPDFRFAPAFKEIPHPPTRTALWKDRVRTNRPLLEMIVQNMPDTEQATTAKQMLERIDMP